MSLNGVRLWPLTFSLMLSTKPYGSLYKIGGWLSVEVRCATRPIKGHQGSIHCHLYGVAIPPHRQVFLTIMDCKIQLWTLQRHWPYQITACSRPWSYWTWYAEAKVDGYIWKSKPHLWTSCGLKKPLIEIRKIQNCDSETALHQNLLDKVKES